MEPASFTEQVRQELASQPLGTDAQVHAELAGLARCAGSLTVIGGQTQLRLTLTSTSGAVARRSYALIQKRFGLRPELAVRAAGGVRRRSTYEVRLGEGTLGVATDLGLVDQHSRPLTRIPFGPGHGSAAAFVRGAVLASASFSAPGRPPHLELVAGSAHLATALADLLATQLDTTVTVADDGRNRIVIKSGAVIGDVLVMIGATDAFLQWDERRLRRQLRNEANRLANADSANLARTIDAASRQIAAVEAVLAQVGWGALDEQLREVALARLANPAATLDEVGELLDPPVGKSAVHRRLRRLSELGQPFDDDGS